MLKHSQFIKFLFAAYLMVSLFSCVKETGGGSISKTQEGDGMSIDFKVGPLSYEEETKISVSQTGKTHTISWSKGDQISMFAYRKPTAAGESASANVANFSSERFTATGSGASASFSGKIPAEFADLAQTGTVPLYMIYPAADLTIAEQSSSNSGYVNYNITGLSIPSVQDGTGWKYCWFASVNAKYDFAEGNLSESPVPTFNLVNCLVKMTVKSAKKIRKIDIVSKNSYMAGDIVLYTGRVAVQTGCIKRTLTIDNGGILPDEVYFACRLLNNYDSSRVPGTEEITFTFTAEDGNKTVRVLKPSADPTTGQYRSGTLCNLGTVELDWGTSTTVELASDAVTNMGVGLNLCGSFDDKLKYYNDNASGSITREDPKTFETMNGRSLTTAQTMISTAEAGFKTMRIPVTWYPHMDNTLSEIDDAYLDRLEEVVGYALDAGLYCIINVHHDCGDNARTWLLADWTNYADISARFKNIWTQVATRFKDYDQRLLFESYNEIVDANRSWFWSSDPTAFDAANALNQDFVNVVRATGGVNANRNLIVTTFSAGTLAPSLEEFVLPSDSVPGHLIVQVHSYLPAEFVTAKSTGRAEYYESDEAEIDDMFNILRIQLLNKGYPVVIGEYGAYRKQLSDGTYNDVHRGRHAAVYTRKALKLGIAPIYWYNPMEWGDRSAGRWTYPVVKDALIDAYNQHINNL